MVANIHLFDGTVTHPSCGIVDLNAQDLAMDVLATLTIQHQTTGYPEQLYVAIHDTGGGTFLAVTEEGDCTDIHLLPIH